MPKILLRCNLLAVHTRTALGKSRCLEKGSDPMPKILL
jgi:hypothetical protein